METLITAWREHRWRRSSEVLLNALATRPKAHVWRLPGSSGDPNWRHTPRPPTTRSVDHGVSATRQLCTRDKPVHSGWNSVLALSCTRLGSVMIEGSTWLPTKTAMWHLQCSLHVLCMFISRMSTPGSLVDITPREAHDRWPCASLEMTKSVRL